MKSPMPGDPEFDHAMRALHDAAGASLSPTTLARLRAARHSLPNGRSASHLASRWRWLGASLAALVLVVAVGVRTGQQAGTGPAAESAGVAATGGLDEFESAYPSALAALDEDPDLYLWLASESQPLTLEQ